MKTIKTLRDDIERIDAQIIKKLALREKKIKQIALIKKASGARIRNPAREQQLLRKYARWSREANLSPVWVKKIFRAIIQHSRSVQKSIC